ncbi:MAG: leucine-rich repeat domain-containing protein, partial [Treponema sp.]|nr:leucine-rich repeat domain-containing protein [Treponema sp.]
MTNVDEVASLTGLKWLRLNSNKLSSLPPLGGLKSLRRIYLADNAFESV